MNLTYGVSMVRDEVDVIEGTIRHMADEVDRLIVADNGSTDGTREILDRLESELLLTVVDDPEPAYYQSQKMTLLAEKAAAQGAEWIVPFDSDEIWYSRFGRIREVLDNLPSNVTVAAATLYNHFCTALDEPGDNPFSSMVWRMRAPGALPKVALRWEFGAVIEQGNHNCLMPSGGERLEVLELRHFPYRSPRQMVRKARNGAAAYKAAEGLPAEYGVHWRAYGEIIDRHGEVALEDVFREHFWYLSPIDSGMVHDPAPYLRWRR